MIVPGLDSFEDLLSGMKDMYEKLNKECEALRETLNAYNEEDEIRKRDERIRELQERSLYIFSEEESRNDKEFRKAHWHSCENSGVFDYRIAGTGVENCIAVICPFCGKSKDLVVDAGNW
jgi:hypothetical protein|nr:MAG TPA: restriction alleviation protein [Caudoviricetes sp.]